MIPIIVDSLVPPTNEGDVFASVHGPRRSAEEELMTEVDITIRMNSVDNGKPIGRTWGPELVKKHHVRVHVTNDPGMAHSEEETMTLIKSEKLNTTIPFTISDLTKSDGIAYTGGEP